MQRTLSYNPVTKMRQEFHVEAHDPDTATIHTTQDVTEALEHTKSQMAMVDARTPWGEADKVAEIPLVVYQDLMKRGIVEDDKKFRRWLNDRDNIHFRTRPGKI